MVKNIHLDFWIKNNYNVLFTGKHGVGKSSIVISAFNRAKLNWKYFSAATMDPWVDFVGVPKEKIDENGNSYLDLIRPKEFQGDEIEAIFFDEFNRASKKVRNSVLELLQFKSINGKKFNKLKIIWAAINPAGEDEEYDTEQLDPAQEDRFHIKVDIPYSPDLKYFIDRYGAQNAKAAVEWWKDLPKEIQKNVSPRRLDYALDVYYNKGDLNYVLPKGTNVGKLLQGLTNGPILETLQKVLKDNNVEEARKFINIENNYMASLNYILKNKQIFNFYFPLLEKEKISSIFATSFKDNKPMIKQIIMNSVENKDIQEVIQSIIEAETNKPLNKYLIKLIKEMGLKDKFNIVSTNLENTYTRLKILYDCKTTISNLHKNLGATEKEYEDVLSKIEVVLKRTQYYTIKHRSFIKTMISGCLPRLSYGKNYIEFTKKFPEIYGKCGFKF